MKLELVAACEAAMTGERPREIEPFYRHRNTLFAHHAVALLLMLCPNIEVLKYEESNRIVEDILRRNSYGLLPATHLEKLRNVTLLPTSDFTLGDDTFYINLNILAMLRLFHRLPAIESVSTDAVGQNDDGGYIEQFPPATSNLKRTHVGHSLYGRQVIGQLIRVPKRLEEVTITTGGRCNLDGGYPIGYAKAMGEALYGHMSSLCKIDIDIDEYLGGGEQDDPYRSIN